jgi:SAM-dependent methyltransferase
MSLWASLAHVVASLPAPVRWRVRNAVALVRGLSPGTPDSRDDAYPDEFWRLHAGGDWPGLARVVLQFGAPASLVDVGCGDGKLLAAIHTNAPDITLLGVDGSGAALRRAECAGVPVRAHNLSSRRSADQRTLADWIGGFDVAVSLETAEHLPPWCASGFVAALSRARLVVFSAAQPGQGGTLHMNERPAAYWRMKFEKHGLLPASLDEQFRAAVASLDLPWWYGKNVHLYERRG